MGKYLRTMEMTHGGGFRCFLCGAILEVTIDATGVVVRAGCAPCGMTMLLELADPVDVRPTANSIPPFYRPLVRKGELRCLNCGDCLVRSLEGAFAYTHTCRICKSKVEVHVQPPASPAIGAPPSESAARISRPATPAFIGRST